MAISGRTWRSAALIGSSAGLSCGNECLGDPRNRDPSLAAFPTKCRATRRFPQRGFQAFEGRSSVLEPFPAKAGLSGGLPLDCATSGGGLRLSSLMGTGGEPFRKICKNWSFSETWGRFPPSNAGAEHLVEINSAETTTRFVLTMRSATSLRSSCKIDQSNMACPERETSGRSQPGGPRMDISLNQSRRLHEVRTKDRVKTQRFKSLLQIGSILDGRSIFIFEEASINQDIKIFFSAGAAPSFSRSAHQLAYSSDFWP